MHGWLYVVMLVCVSIVHDNAKQFWQTIVRKLT